MNANNDPLGVEFCLSVSGGRIPREGLLGSASTPNWLSPSSRCFECRHYYSGVSTFDAALSTLSTADSSVDAAAPLIAAIGACSVHVRPTVSWCVHVHASAVCWRNISRWPWVADIVRPSLNPAHWRIGVTANPPALSDCRRCDCHANSQRQQCCRQPDHRLLPSDKARQT
jgi:hypothetical protein